MSFVTYAAGALALWMPSVVLAQDVTGVAEEKSLAMRWVAIAVFAAACVAIAMKNPKRSHQG
jgi:hypothetical protein